ncbi:MAG: hypothetical protein ABDH18_05180 [Aquificaceae bacterium]
MKKVISLSLAFSVFVGAQGLSVGEHYTLRSYTGQAFGSAMANALKFKSIHVITNNTSICSSLVGAIGSEYLDPEGNRRMLVTVLNSPEDARGLSPKEEAVLIILGGQLAQDANYGLLKNTLRQLAEAKYNGAIFFHLRVFAPKLVERAAQEDQTIAQYLEKKENLFSVTPDLPNKSVKLVQVSVKEGKQGIAKELGTVKMNPVWEELFKRSL